MGKRSIFVLCVLAAGSRAEEVETCDGTAGAEWADDVSLLALRGKESQKSAASCPEGDEAERKQHCCYVGQCGECKAGCSDTWDKCIYDGFAQCGLETCSEVLENRDNFGETYMTIPNSDVLSCQQKCRKEGEDVSGRPSGGCWGWTWTQDSRTCELKTGRLDYSPVRKAGVTSGYCDGKISPTIYRCQPMMIGQDIAGATLANRRGSRKAQIPQECKSRCDQDTDCIGWVWNAKNRACELMEEDVLDQPFQDEDFVSGYCY